MNIDIVQAQLAATSSFAEQLTALLTQDPANEAQLQVSALQQKQNQLDALQALLDSTTAARTAAANAYEQKIADLQGQIGAVQEQIRQMQAGATPSDSSSAVAAPSAATTTTNPAEPAKVTAPKTQKATSRKPQTGASSTAEPQKGTK